MTADELRVLFSYNPQTGAWARLYKPRTGRRHANAGSTAGNGYLQIKVAGKVYAQHRLAWLYVHGEWPDGEIDHINGDQTDNRIANLRVVTSSANKQNRRTAHGKVPLVGVSYDDRRHAFYAQISVSGRHRHLGYFDDAESAFAAYVDAKRRLHEGNTL